MGVMLGVGVKEHVSQQAPTAARGARVLGWDHGACYKEFKAEGVVESCREGYGVKHAKRTGRCHAGRSACVRVSAVENTSHDSYCRPFMIPILHPGPDVPFRSQAVHRARGGAGAEPLRGLVRAGVTAAGAAAGDPGGAAGGAQEVSRGGVSGRLCTDSCCTRGGDEQRGLKVILKLLAAHV